MSSTTPALNDTEGNQATTLKNKEKMVRRVAFMRPPEDPVSLPHSKSGIVHQGIDTKTIWRVLYDQAQTKAPGPDHINFRALRLLYECDAVQVTAVIR